MTQIQSLGSAALKCKALPQKAKPFAETLVRSGVELNQGVKAHAISAFLARTADWKSPTGKRVKKELRVILTQLAPCLLLGFLLVGKGTHYMTPLQSYETREQCERNGEVLSNAFTGGYVCIEDREEAARNG